MNRTDGRIIDRWHAEATVDRAHPVWPNAIDDATGRRLNRDEIHRAARRRGVKP